MPLNKPALEALNQTNFPDNQEQLITPILLREFNDEMINSMELTQSMDSYANLGTANIFYGGNQSIAKEYKLFTNGVYWNNNTAGYNNLEIINSITGNIDIAALGGGVRIVSSSLNIMNGTFTASLAEGFTYVGNSSGRSVLVATSSFGSVTSAITASSLITASFDNGTRNLTFTKGDASTFNVNIPDVSGSTINTGSFATTGSNTFNGNQTISGSVAVKNALTFPNGFGFLGNAGDVSQISAATTIQLITEPPAGPGGTNDIKFINRVTSSFVGFINEQGGAGNEVYFEAGELDFNIGARSGSTGIVTFRSTVVGIDASSTPITASAFKAGAGGINSAGALTASLANGFTYVGNSSNVSTLVATSSFGSSINTGSFATTGSNTFVGNQTITTAGNTQLNIISTDPSGQANLDFQAPNANFRAYGLFQINNNGQYGGSGSIQILTKDNNMTLAADQGFRFGVTNGVGNGIDPSGYVTINVPSGSQQFQLTGSLVVSNTLTASLAQGYVLVGDSNNRTTLVATSSFGGGGAAGATLGANTFTGSQTISNASLILNSTGSGFFTLNATTQNNILFNSPSNQFTSYGSFVLNNNGNAGGSGSLSFIAVSSSVSFASRDGFLFGRATPEGGILGNGGVKMNTSSGSFVLAPSGFNVAGTDLLYLSSSSNSNNLNLIFKSNNNTGTTIISGSNNIFSNPNTPTTGYTKYIGGNNNIYLNNANGITSEITASAASVSGNRPTMNNNIFNGTSGFTINQANNPGTHTLSHNIISNGSTTINALAFTGSLNFQSNFNNNGTITINAASQSIAQIATGLSGSGTITMAGNGLFGGTITNTSSRILLTTNTQTVSSNIIAGGSIVINNISASANVNASSNITNGTISYTNASATGVHTSVGGISTTQGGYTANAIGSAVSIANNLTLGGVTLTNQSFSGSAGTGLLSANRNLFQGQGHTLLATGSQEGTSAANFSDNTILGKTNTIFSNLTGAGNYRDLNGCIIAGQNLIVSASNSFALTEGGSAHFGRYNANDGIRNKTGENVFSVGTGTSSARKTGFLIDSGSNSYFEGTLNVSGSTTMTGSLILSSSNAVELFVIGDSQFTGSVKVASTFQLQLPTGSNQQAGTAVLDGGNPGTVTVSNSLVTANSIIMVSKQTLTNAHMVAVSSKGAGTFTITSNGNGDADTVGWFIINNS